MNDFFLNIKSPGWWLGVVVVSFLINLASAYAKPLIDGFLATVSDRRRKKLEHAKIELDRQAEIVESRPDGAVLLTLEQLKLMLFAFGILTLCLLLLFSVYILSPMFHAEFALPLIIIFLIGALFCLREAKRKDILLGLLKKRRGIRD